VRRIWLRKNGRKIFFTFHTIREHRGPPIKDQNLVLAVLILKSIFKAAKLSKTNFFLIFENLAPMQYSNQ